MHIDKAVESKRFHHQCLPDIIQIEKHSLSIDVINKLQSMGHKITYRSDIGIGEANCIMYDSDLFFGSADSRRNAKALAY